MRHILCSLPQMIYFCMIHAFTCGVLCESPAVAPGLPAIQCHLTSLALHVLWDKGVCGLREPALGALPGNGHGAVHLLHGLGTGSDH